MSQRSDGAGSGIELVRRSFEAFSSGDLDACVEVLTPDFIANFPGTPEPVRGREAWKQNALGFLEAFPDLQVDIDDIFGADDRVAVRLTFRGTHRGSFMGTPPTGRQVTFTSIEIYRVSGDLLAEEWVSPDVGTLMAQITASPDGG